MPGRDRTGPQGAGPITGRGMGYCRGFEQPGFVNQGGAFRGGFGFRRGGAGRGWRHRFYATGTTRWATTNPEQETADLKAQANLLKTQLDAIQRRIEELSSTQSES